MPVMHDAQWRLSLQGRHDVVSLSADLMDQILLDMKGSVAFVSHGRRILRTRPVAIPEFSIFELLKDRGMLFPLSEDVIEAHCHFPWLHGAS
jgi:hypothetical protein